MCMLSLKRVDESDNINSDNRTILSMYIREG